MAIERNAGPAMMPEEAPPEAAPEAEASGGTATIPAISIDGVPCKVGDTLKVVAAEGDNLTVKYVSHESENPEEEAAPGKGVEGMAAEFD